VSGVTQRTYFMRAQLLRMVVGRRAEKRCPEKGGEIFAHTYRKLDGFRRRVNNSVALRRLDMAQPTRPTRQLDTPCMVGPFNGGPFFFGEIDNGANTCNLAESPTQMGRGKLTAGGSRSDWVNGLPQQHFRLMSDLRCWTHDLC
jgi:hypothetical protein